MRGNGNEAQFLTSAPRCQLLARVFSKLCAHIHSTATRRPTRRKRVLLRNDATPRRSDFVVCLSDWSDWCSLASVYRGHFVLFWNGWNDSRCIHMRFTVRIRINWWFTAHNYPSVIDNVDGWMKGGNVSCICHDWAWSSATHATDRKKCEDLNGFLEKISKI